MKLSTHFDTSEFDCHGSGCCNGLGYTVNRKLIDLLEQLRSNIGGYPLHINSGVRCSIHNAEVGGVPNSQHVLGNAADVAVPDELTIDEFKWYCEQLPFDGIGVYYDANFIHLDVRDGGIGAGYFWEE